MIVSQVPDSYRNYKGAPDARYKSTILYIIFTILFTYVSMAQEMEGRDLFQIKYIKSVDITTAIRCQIW